MASKILIIGSSGQIGTELVLKLRQIKGNDNVIASDIRFGNYEVMKSGHFEILDATSKRDVLRVVEKFEVIGDGLLGMDYLTAADAWVGTREGKLHMQVEVSCGKKNTV